MKQILENLSKQESIIPSREGFQKENYSDYADIVKNCCNLNKHIEVAFTDNFAITKHAYGYVKYLEVHWIVHKDFFKSVPKEEAAAWIIDKVMLNTHYDSLSDENASIFMQRNLEDELPMSDGVSFYLPATIKVQGQWRPKENY